MSKKIRFKIDEKSLYYGCINDFNKGHTATVSTPLNQSINPQKWRNEILELINTSARVPNEKLPEFLLSQCQSASKSENVIQDVFIFSNILVDGVKLETDFQFIMYIKKETSKKIKNKNGNIVSNTHLGRLKLHYPITFKYKTDGYNIDNNEILKQILDLNKNYAYIVRGFEYDEDIKSLNIITSLIGIKGALLSTVFKVKKGVGKKLRTDVKSILDFAEYDNKVLDDDDIIYDKYSKKNKTSIYNGKKGEDYVYDKCLRDKKDVYHTSVEFPESPYDIEYIDEKGSKVFVEVKSTQSSKVYFRMSTYEYNFMEKYKNQYIMYVVLNVKDEFPDVIMLTYQDIIKLNKKIIGYSFSK